MLRLFVRLISRSFVRCLPVALWGLVSAAMAAGGDHWVTSWAASVQGPYPVGNPSAQPNLSLVFPAPEAGARDQQADEQREPRGE